MASLTGGQVGEGHGFPAINGVDGDPADFLPLRYHGLERAEAGWVVYAVALLACLSFAVLSVSIEVHIVFDFAGFFGYGVPLLGGRVL